MKRVIVDYSKLTGEILNLLVEKFPDGYDDSDIVRFKNAKNETIEAVEVRTVDTIFLVKISTKLSDRIINYDEDDELADDVEDVEDNSIEALKELEIDDDSDDDDDSEKLETNDDGDSDDDDDDDKDEPIDEDSDEDDED
ncbi:DNA primase [Flavobacterium sp.]|uniref:DNA primase n=1 Tax=Flavobacterium sp. TaxID=239 RepID=UPI00374D4CCC